MYMVYVTGAETPKRIHNTFNDANIEAKRLCKKTGQPTYILQAIKKIELNEFKETDLTQDLQF